MCRKVSEVSEVSESVGSVGSPPKEVASKEVHLDNSMCRKVSEVSEVSVQKLGLTKVNNKNGSKKLKQV